MHKIRPYQTQAILNTLRDIRSQQYKAPVLILPTGGGKTFTAVKVIEGLLQDYSPNEILVWVTHRTELADQAEKAMLQNGLAPVFWNAETKNVGRIIIAMIASSRSLAQELTNKGLTCKHVVIDEAHRRAAPSYKKLEGELNPQCTLGLTATPIRMDDVDLEFDKVSYEISFLDLVSQNYLAKPKYISYKTGLQHQLHTQSDDYSLADLRTLNNEKRNDIIAKDYAKNRDEYGKTLVFCVDVEHCYDLQKAYAQYTPGTNTAVITGTLAQADRARILKEFRDGVIDVIFNVMVFTEGFDEPSIRTIQMTRPTKSESLWCQMIGRGSRPHPTKPYFNIVDYCDGENNYGLMSEDWAIRLLGVEESPERKQQREDALTVDAYKTWAQNIGFTGKIPKEKREVLEIDGILELATRAGIKRYLVRKQHRARLEKLTRYIAQNPPKAQEDMKTYILNYAYKQDKSLLRWPGKYTLSTLAWALYFRFVLNKPATDGSPAFKYKSIPDFSLEKTTNEPTRNTCT